MKRNFWICLLVLSLALNLGGLATFAYLRSQDRREAVTGRGPSPPPRLEIWATLNLEGEQRQVLENLLPEHRRRVREMRTELAHKRQELFDVIKESNPAWTSVQAKIGEVSRLQGDLEMETVGFWLEVQKHFTPEQKVVFQEMLKCQMLAAEGRHPGGVPVFRPRQPASKFW
jgi:Spy/CpxP family protein refolding chaperone